MDFKALSFFTDTDTFLEPKEEAVIKQIDKHGGFYLVDSHLNIDILCELEKRCHICGFQTGNDYYFYLKNNTRSKPITVEFHAYFPKILMGNDGLQIISEKEKNKIAYARGFISRWVYKQKKIDDKKYIDFIRLYTNKLKYIISIPSFVFHLFKQEIETANIEYNILTPNYQDITCPYCGHIFEIKSGNKKECPNCNEDLERIPLS